MDTILSTNVLFYTLSVFFILLTMGFLVVFIYVIMIFRVIKREAQKIENDIDAVREKLKNGGTAVASFLVYITSLFNKNKKSRK